jgi:hypothetical protein
MRPFKEIPPSVRLISGAPTYMDFAQQLPINLLLLIISYVSWRSLEGITSLVSLKIELLSKR